VPTPLTHAAVGYALGTWLHPRRPDARVSLAAAACAALPDLDAIGWVEHIPDTSVFAHRAITHSLLVAVLAALVATALLFRRQPWARDRARIAVTLGVALLSHSCLDALSTYSLGIEFFAPFSSHRFRFPWTPLGNPHWSLFAQLAQEVVLVLLPALFAAWLGFRVRPGRKLAQPCSGLTGG
jgi:inner membrane protein